MKRRDAIVVCCALVLGRFPVAYAQARPRIGLLSIGTDPIKPNPVWVAFLEELRRFGYVEGQKIDVERRFAGGDEKRLPGFAADLAKRSLIVAVATGDVECIALKKAMPQTPIVMVLVQDPVGAGLVGSLARPGGNVTGLTTQAPELYAKRLELMKGLIPSLSTVGLLFNPTSPAAALALDDMAAAARLLGVKVEPVQLRNADELEKAFAVLRHKHAQAMAVVTDGVTYNQRGRIGDLAAKGRLPAIYEVEIFASAGGLISYGPSYTDLARRAATYVDKILRGAKPAELPIEQPTKFELVINAPAAKALGLTIPKELLLRADRVIE